MGAYKRHKWILDKEILLFVLPTATNDKWQLRFKNPLKDGGRYVRKSTGHTSEGLATAFAVQLYKEYQSRALLNLKNAHTTIDFLMDSFAYEFDRVSLSIMRGFHRGYWKRYMADQDLSTWTSDNITEYFNWRISDKIEDGKNPEKNKRRWNPSESTLSASNLKLERNMMRRLFQMGFKHNYIARMPSFPKRLDRWAGVHKLPSNKRRGRFDPVKDYQGILMPAFKQISDSLKNTDWMPVLVDPDLPFDPETNKYQSISKRDGAEGRETRSKVYCHTWDRYNCATFWFMALLIANSGIRPSAAARLKHRDIRVVEDDDGKLYTLINIDESISKTGKGRIVVCRDFHKTYERYILYCQELMFRFSKNLKPDDWMFPATNKKEFYTNYRRKYDAVFRVHLKRLGLHTTEVEGYPGIKVYYSAYSFRSFFISQRLRNGMDLYTLSKNVGSSPKTILAAYDYNENWEFRRQITKHYKADFEHDAPEYLREHVEYWR